MNELEVTYSLLSIHFIGSWWNRFRK